MLNKRVNSFPIGIEKFRNSNGNINTLFFKITKENNRNTRKLN